MNFRVLVAFRRLAGREGGCLMVIHGGPTAAMMAKLFPEEGKSRCAWRLPEERAMSDRL